MHHRRYWLSSELRLCSVACVQVEDVVVGLALVKFGFECVFVVFVNLDAMLSVRVRVLDRGYLGLGFFAANVSSTVVLLRRHWK